MDLLKPDLRSMMQEEFTTHNAIQRVRAVTAPLGWIFALIVCVTALPVQTKTSHQNPDWDSQIVPGSKITVLDLTRLLIPDAQRVDAKGDKITGSDRSGIRLLDGVAETGMELDLESDDECEITDPDYFWLTNGGERHLVLLLRLEIDKLVLVLYKTSPVVDLLDAVTIAQDIHVDVDSEKLWQIHPQHQAFVAHSWHDNSSESFDRHTFISVVDGKLRAVADPASSYGFTEYSAARRRVCKTATSPGFRFVRSALNYFDLIVTETTLKVCHSDSEEWSWKTGIVSKRAVSRVWRWSPKSKQYRRTSLRRK